MRKALVSIVLLGLGGLLTSCGEPRHSNVVNKPASIRGWINEIEKTLPPGVDPSVVMQGQTLEDYLRDANVYLKGTVKVTGGLMNGAFVMLDIPSGDETIVFQAPGIDESAMTIKGIPPTADVVLSGVNVTKHGAKLADPSKAVIRIAAKVDEIREIPSTTTIDGVKIRTVEVPLRLMGDRMNYIERGAFPYEPGYVNPDFPNAGKSQ